MVYVPAVENVVVVEATLLLMVTAELISMAVPPVGV